MEIRVATPADLPQLVRMGIEFMRAVPPYTEWTPNPEVLEATAHEMLTTRGRTIFVADMSGWMVGMLGVAIYRHPLTGEPTATELFWWVSPAWRGRVGLQLLRRAERWAGEQGAVRIQMISPNPEVGRLYARRGYVALGETTYHKSIEVRDCNDYTTQEKTA